VVVIQGDWLGETGKVKERKAKDWVITFSVNDKTRDFILQE
jgi:hypothetical protein